MKKTQPLSVSSYAFCEDCKEGVCLTCGRDMDKIIMDLKMESMLAYAKGGSPTYILPGEEEWWAERLLTEEEREA